jgi:hypothetical protein
MADKPRISDPEVKARLAKIPRMKERTEPHHLPGWTKIACVKHELLGQSWRQIAKDLGKNKARVQDLVNTPAAKKFREAMAEMTGDPVELARAVLKGAAVGLAVENLLHYEAAKKAGDNAEAGRQLRFLTETVGVSMPKNADAVPTQITINLGGGISVSADIPHGESEGTKILPAEILNDDDV